MRPSTPRSLRLFLSRWHRRLGVVAALFVVILSITGVLLNHTDSLKLAERFPQSSLLLWPYQSVVTETVQYKINDGLLYAENNQLKLDTNALAPCARLTQATSFNRGYLVNCETSWYFFDINWELIEAINPSVLGLTGEEELGRYQNQAAVKVLNKNTGQNPSQAQAQWYPLDLDNMQLGKRIDHPTSQISTLSVITHRKNQSISWQRVLLDMHSGRWFGRWGIWLMDAAAIFLLILAGSGVWMWGIRKRY